MKAYCVSVAISGVTQNFCQQKVFQLKVQWHILCQNTTHINPVVLIVVKQKTVNEIELLTMLKMFLRLCI
jgi:hypothetical protein